MVTKSGHLEAVAIPTRQVRIQAKGEILCALLASCLLLGSGGCDRSDDPSTDPNQASVQWDSIGCDPTDKYSWEKVLADMKEANVEVTVTDVSGVNEHQVMQYSYVVRLDEPESPPVEWPTSWPLLAKSRPIYKIEHTFSKASVEPFGDFVDTKGRTKGVIRMNLTVTRTTAQVHTLVQIAPGRYCVLGGDVPGPILETQGHDKALRKILRTLDRKFVPAVRLQVQIWRELAKEEREKRDGNAPPVRRRATGTTSLPPPSPGSTSPASAG